MYVDESGDIGTKPDSSPYFSLSGLVVHESLWNRLIFDLESIKLKLLTKYKVPHVEELHVTDFLGRSNHKRPLPKNLAYLFYRDLLREEAKLDYIRILNVVLSKADKYEQFDFFSGAWERLINRFEMSLKHRVFYSLFGNSIQEKGLLIVDETNEKVLRSLTRRMRNESLVPSYFGGCNQDAILQDIIEDPVHRNSRLSIPIQFCDANAYFASQLFHPSSATKKYKARNYLYYLEPILTKEACRKNSLGIVRD